MAEPANASRERVFLVVVDESPEMPNALRYACRRAKRTGGRVALLYVMHPPEGQQWGAVVDLMRQEARQEYLEDRDFGGDRVDHHDDGRRQQDAQRAGAAEGTQRGLLVVAAPHQLGQGDLGDGGAGRGGRARHRAENAAGQHVDVHQPARQPVQPRRKATEHLFRQPRAKQNLAHPDEQRKGCERPRGAVAPDRGGEHGPRRNVAADELHADPADRHQGDRDPHAAAQQDGEQRQQDE